MSKKSRKEAEQPDAFITFSDKVIKWVEVHYRSMFTFIGVIVVGGALLAGYQFFSKRSEMKAMQALYGYEKKLSDKIEQLEKSDAEGIAEESEDKDKKVAKNEDSKKLEKTPEVLKQNLAEEISELKNFISSHKGTRAAFVGRLTVAQTYSDFGMDQEALEVLNQGTTSFSKDSLFYGLIHQRIG
ncbi:MAG: hypothetical protein KDD61_03830, partial [Bdellovibrionales bacterium]|nr:hypothetical protein [Bdellovibrionales bacterium]